MNVLLNGFETNEAISPQIIATVTPPDAAVNAPVIIPLAPCSEIAFSILFLQQYPKARGRNVSKIFCVNSQILTGNNAQ